MSRRNFLSVILVWLILPLLAIYVFAHSGGTDSKGGHTDRSTGEYHYHHGYPAHEHYDIDGDGTIDCPYNFQDESGSNQSSNSEQFPFWGIVAICYTSAAVLFVPFALLTDHLRTSGCGDAASLLDGIPVTLWLLSWPLSELLRRIMDSHLKKKQK